MAGYIGIVLAIVPLTIFVVVTRGSAAAMTAVRVSLWVIPVLIAPAVGAFLAYCLARIADLRNIRSDQRGALQSLAHELRTATRTFSKADNPSPAANSVEPPRQAAGDGR